MADPCQDCVVKMEAFADPLPTEGNQYASPSGEYCEGSTSCLTMVCAGRQSYLKQDCHLVGAAKNKPCGNKVCHSSSLISVSDSMNVSTNCKVEVKTETQEHIDFCSNDESSDQMEIEDFNINHIKTETKVKKEQDDEHLSKILHVLKSYDEVLRRNQIHS